MEAYAPYAQAVARQGFCAAILETNTNPGIVVSLMLTKPTFKYWGFVGHGDGGVLAADLAYVLQPKVTFITLLAAPITTNLSALNLVVVAGYTAADETFNSTAVQDSISKLPSDALVVSYSNLGHFDFADSSCSSNSTVDSGTPSLTDLVSLSLNRAIWPQATTNSLSYSNKTFLTPGSNSSKPYPNNATYTVTFSAVPIPSTAPQRFWYVFTPTPIAGSANAVKAGIAYYTGTSVDTKAYFQIAFEMAAYGYVVVLIENPLRAAVFFDLDAAGQLINSTNPAFNPVPKGAWVVGGHSAGAVAASLYAFEYPATVRALVMHAGTFLPGTSFANSSLPVLGVVGQLDGTLTVSLEEDERSFYADSTNSSVSKFVVVPGANHGGTGDYGPQPGDNFATISGDEQKRTFAAVTAAFLDPIFT
ncbi:hypothetical protein KFL_000740010 [Klebsormidium nitens]|uniref:Alpha/beta hydrolase fold-5 domain-containing protein n=1 Tax=Klebsormidium nitens TaxID=105231 RepID=A0A1Y1HRE3_KLENI|nr:hypothetical protein KFL_000740010 [Klebsormidium nitens]|eukprot:GAQ81200.1 hypothetical protein KFL_000740010 [Klebsormidium nitens]